MGWMINDLKLKGHALLVYAMIYGFTQDGETKYTGSFNYLANAISVNRRTIIRIIQSLVTDGLIIKSQVSNNNLVFNEFVINPEMLGGGKMSPLVTKMSEGGGKMSPLGGGKMSPNITINNNTKDSGRAFSFLKVNYPERLTTFEMQNKKLIKDYEKFILDFDDTVDMESLEYTSKILFGRLNKYARNWVQNQNKFQVIKNECGLKKLPQRKIS